MSTLTPQQLEAYQNTGFLLVKGFVPLAQVAEIRDEVAGLHAALAGRESIPGLGITWEDLPEGEPPQIRQLMGSQNVSQSLREIASSPRLWCAIEQLLGEPVELFHSKLMMKAAHKGSFTPWHSDWGYWRDIFERPAQMNAFLAIDPSTLENGCIRYVPESHHAYTEHQQMESRSGFSIGLPGDIDAYDAVPLEMEPGDEAFHGSLTIHASEGNQSDHSRIMNTFAYTAVSCFKTGREGFSAQRLQQDKLINLAELA